MKQNYTEFIVRIYKEQKDFPEDVFMKWLKIALGNKVEGRKITVKKHKRLSKKEVIKVIDNPDWGSKEKDWMIDWGEENLAKAIYKAQGR